MKLILLILATLFSQANQQYADGNYAEAANGYQQVLSEDAINPMLSSSEKATVLFNLGNAYFKQGELAQSILCYERSLRLRPTNKDAQFNLKFAQSRITDNIEDSTTFFLSKWAASLRNLLSENTWLYMSIAFFWVVLICLFGFLLGQTSGLRKTSFYIGIVALVLSICTGANALSLHQRDAARAEAIITQGIVNAKSSPDKSGTDLFTLHEGTKVEIKETIGEWGNIHVGNNVGWVPLKTLERI